MFLHGKHPKAQLVACVRALPSAFTKNADGTYFDLHGQLHGLKIHLTAFRAAMCGRVVVGLRQETVEEPDPEALAAVPTRQVTRIVEKVEWRCTPLLATEKDPGCPGQS